MAIGSSRAGDQSGGTQGGSVEITIDRSGAVYFKVRGVKGAGCMDLTEALEKALGTVASRSEPASITKLH